MSVTKIPHTNVTVTKCPPAIAQGANVDKITRRQVNAARRAWRKQNSKKA